MEDVREERVKEKEEWIQFGLPSPTVREDKTEISLPLNRMWIHLFVHSLSVRSTHSMDYPPSYAISFN